MVRDILQLRLQPRCWCHKVSTVLQGSLLALVVVGQGAQVCARERLLQVNPPIHPTLWQAAGAEASIWPAAPFA